MAHSDEIKGMIQDIKGMDGADTETEALLAIVSVLNEINWTQTFIKKNIESISKQTKSNHDYDTGPSNYY